MFDAFNETSPVVEDLVETYIEIYKNMDASGEISREIAKIKTQIEHERKKKKKILDYNLNGDITDDDYLQMNKECKEVIEELEMKLADLYDQQNNKDDFKKHIDEIRRTLKAAQKDAANGVITKEFVNKYIDRILATPEGDRMRLDIKVLVGQTCEKYLSNVRSRTGHMSKKMIQQYENNMK